MKVTIGITDCNKFENYENWILAYDQDIEVMRLSERLQNLEDAKNCQGILFSGGEDVHPRFYGKPEYLTRIFQ